MKRRIFSVLIAPALADGAGTADDPWTCGDGVTDVLDSGTLTISYTGTGTGP